MKLVAIVGTNAKQSYNRSLLQFMKKHFASKADIEILEITDVPMFNETDDQTDTPVIQKFNQAISEADGVIISTPEHNHTIPSSLNSLLGSEVQLNYFGGVLYQYAKNLYYYSYINENIRAGKNKFSMPLKGENSKVTTNFSVIKLYIEAMIASFFQDLNPKDTKLTIKNTQILDLFKTHFGEQISEMVKLTSDDFLQAFYAPILSQVKDSKAFVSVLSSSLQENDLVNLKDALYKLDFWISFSFFKKLETLKL